MFKTGRRTFSLLLAGAMAACIGGTTAQAGDRVANANALEALALMSVDGELVIEPDGRVSEAKISTKIEAGLAASLETAMLGWRFHPVRIGGEPRRAKTRVHLELAARKIEGENYKVWVDNVGFADAYNEGAARPDGQPAPITGKRLIPPRYPTALQSRGVMGAVLLAIRVTPEGYAEDVMVVQSLLYETGRDTALSSSTAHIFEVNAASAARRWTFDVPPGAARNAEGMTVTVPVVYTLGYDTSVTGVWLKVQRSAKQRIAWLAPDKAQPAMALASAGGGSVSQLGSGPTLVTDVAGTVLP